MEFGFSSQAPLPIRWECRYSVDMPADAVVPQRLRQKTMSCGWGTTHSEAGALKVCLDWMWAKHRAISGEAPDADVDLSLEALTAVLAEHQVPVCALFSSASASGKHFGFPMCVVFHVARVGWNTV